MLKSLFSRKPIPACVDCKWHSREAGALGLWINDICNHPKMRLVRFDPIQGDSSFAPCCNRDFGACKKRGKLFEPKQA